jgi:CRISPR/Cas system-associated exonuclease Cas4 (RecB family)
MRTIKASDISAYLYCQRAWWYRRQGHDPENQEDLVAGQRLHAAHGRKVLASGLQRTVAFILLLLALILLTAYLTARLV